MEQNKKSLPLTWSEVLETEHPFIRYKQQVIVTDNWPDQSCQDCYGLGYIGVVHKESTPMSKLGRNMPCVCKSGKKFKKCCMKIVNQYKSSQGSLATCRCVGSATTLKEVTNGVEEVRKELQNG